MGPVFCFFHDREIMAVGIGCNMGSTRFLQVLRRLRYYRIRHKLDLFDKCARSYKDNEHVDVVVKGSYVFIT